MAYAGQIYYDFSGYSDMAIGVGGMLGFSFPVNFRHPCNSRNITEFWRRRHISLSTRLRDYFYVGLGGNRKGTRRTYFNIMITMLLGGLWHGASWNFVFWGCLHGVALLAHRWWLNLRGRTAEQHWSVPGQLFGWFTTLLFVAACWVFFRAKSFFDAWAILRKIAFLDSPGIHWTYVPALVVIGLAVTLHLGTVLRGNREYRVDLSTPVGWALAEIAMCAVLFWSPLDSSPFIYFQF